MALAAQRLDALQRVQRDRAKRPAMEHEVALKVALHAKLGHKRPRYGQLGYAALRVDVDLYDARVARLAVDAHSPTITPACWCFMRRRRRPRRRMSCRSAQLPRSSS